jgi:Sulfatase-modifying factor enzyme 1
MRRRQRLGKSRRLAHMWTVLLPLYFLAAGTLDPTEVTNREYLQFVLATGHASPEYWVNGRFAAGRENDPVVLVSWHDAVSYCRFAGRRLPTVDEWTASCEAGKLKKRASVWEWTSTDVEMGLRLSAVRVTLAIAPIVTALNGRTKSKGFAVSETRRP